MKIEIQYYAILREKTGRTSETVETKAETPGMLYEELQKRYGFTVPADRIKVGINQEMCDWEQRLNEGDVVVFIPPVAGG